ncbi:MAG: fumarylacetoacetate hydrolase family protein [Steroidobacteraceae bacterium]
MDTHIEVSTPTVGVAGSDRRFPVRRIFCVGRNYADHVREMGGDPSREPPVFFTKPADAVVQPARSVPYPPRTEDLHHEVELVVALGAGGANIDPQQALGCVVGYAVGNDLTRRDLQAVARKAGAPWDMAKGFDCSAPLGEIHPSSEVGHPASGRIWLAVNGVLRQESDLASMIWSVPEIIAELSTYVALRPGDLIFTGTPEGVGPLRPGDRVTAGIDGLGGLDHLIAAA